jgi:hypothetical protein
MDLLTNADGSIDFYMGPAKPSCEKAKKHLDHVMNTLRQLNLSEE